MTPSTRSIRLLLVAGTLSACGDFLNFDITANIDEFVIPGDPWLHHDEAPLDSLDIPPVGVRFASLEGGRIVLSALTFSVTSGSVENEQDDDSLAFLEALEVFAVPGKGTALPPVSVGAWTGPAPEGAVTIALDVSARVDLALYVSAGMEFVIRAKGLVPYDDVSLEGQATFNVEPL